MFELEVLVREGTARVDGHAPGPVPVHEVPALDHEVLDHPVERGPWTINRSINKSIKAAVRNRSITDQLKNQHEEINQLFNIINHLIIKSINRIIQPASQSIKQ